MAIRWMILLLILAGCTGSRAAPEPDEQFGHRFADPAPDGRHTVAITPSEAGESYRYYPATVESVVVRPASYDLTADTLHVPVEVLIKGALPDACMQLHSFEQKRTGNIVNATLQMRRAQSMACATVMRPFRFYVMLDGKYMAGHYTLRLNGKAYPFQIRLPS